MAKEKAPKPSTLSQTPSSPNEATSANYRTSVEMSGWVQKFQARLRTGQVKRYFRLTNSILSNHPTLTGSSTWEVSVSKSLTRTHSSKNLVQVRLPDREIRFQLATAQEMSRWAAAIRSASVCNINDFYKLGAKMGEGAFGEVRLGHDLVTGEKRAVKIVERTCNAKELEFVQREIDVILSISHPNIVKTYDIFDEKDKIYLVMSYVSGGDLFDYIATRGAFPEGVVKTIIWQMMLGIQYLHSQNIVHRDIKPENVLVASTEPLHLQLTDFGFANFENPTSKAPDMDMKSMVGTGCYMAPEVVEACGHGKPVDIFSTGVVFYKLITGRLPFRGMTIKDCYMQARREKGDFMTAEWKKCSKEGRGLCRRMLAADARGRPDARETLGDGWFDGFERVQSEEEEFDSVASFTARKVGRKM